ncbi:MAG: ABC transporter substrate-binding protein [Chloroflexi bacterium]|nr:ABC transporter substrate-binding protein [Chloroflexota bacterium]
MKTMRVMVLAIAVMSALAVTACGTAKDQGGTRISLALDWFPNSNHAGIFEAVERGYFKDEGLDVRVYTPADPSTVLQTVGAGRDDFGISYQPDLLQARSESIPVVSVLAIVQHPLNSVMALAPSGIDSPGDLKGKKVGHPNIASNRAMLATMLATEDVRLTDVELVDVGFDLVPALIGGRVDAVVGAYWTHESIVMEEQGYKVNIMRMEKHGVPDFYELVLVTNEDTLKNRKDVVEKFVRAFRKGFEVAIANPQGSIDTLIKHNPDTVNQPVERKGVDVLQPMWKAEAPKFGWQAEERWVGFANWMKKEGFVKETLDPKAAYTNEFVR